MDGVSADGPLGPECVCQTQLCVCKPAYNSPGSRLCAWITGYTCNPNIWEAEAGVSEVQGYYQFHGKFEVSLLKTEKGKHQFHQFAPLCTRWHCGPDTDETVGKGSKHRGWGGGSWQ